MAATYTQKQIVKHLSAVVNTIGGAFVPQHLAQRIQTAGAAVGLCICTGIYNVDNNTIALYLA